jgi:BirA family biotin operon repressor/biotin-[acetyl-CoA-carboxylase] ligase
MQKKWMDAEKVPWGLRSTIFEKDLLVHDSVDSTNSVARLNAENGRDEGTIVIARTQKAGYGRMKRNWFSPSGGLWFSVILRPHLTPVRAAMITLMAGVAVSETLKEDYQVHATIKWPNDIHIGGKKISGIITEMRTSVSEIEYIILGVGINVNFGALDLPKEVRMGSTTLKDELERDIDLEDLLVATLKRISHYYLMLKDGKFDTILNKWREYSDTLGKRVRIDMPNESIEGLACDLDESGALILKKDSGDIQKIFAGDCIHITVPEGN